MNLDPNLGMLERIAAALGPLRERVVFVGGSATGLLITDPLAAAIRVTKDVDVIGPAKLPGIAGGEPGREHAEGLGHALQGPP